MGSPHVATTSELGMSDKKVATIVWDSSPEGWGAVIRTRADDDGCLVIGTFEPNSGDDFDHQVRRETRGGVLAFRAALKKFDFKGWLIILSNDATGALSTLRKGCAKSEFMQNQAMELVTLARDHQIELLFLHAPGKTLVAERVDEASHDGAKEVRGPAATGRLREAVFELAAQGWNITVDLFASVSNSLVPRFFARSVRRDFRRPGSCLRTGSIVTASMQRSENSSRAGKGMPRKIRSNNTVEVPTMRHMGSVRSVAGGRGRALLSTVYHPTFCGSRFGAGGKGVNPAG